MNLFITEMTDEAKALGSSTGEDIEACFLDSVKDRLGESKLLNDPKFFYFHDKGKFDHRYDIELHGYDIDEFDNSLSLFFCDVSNPMHIVDNDSVNRMWNHSLYFAKIALSPRFRDFQDYLDGSAGDLADEIQRLSNSQLGLTKIRIIVVSNGISTLRKREKQSSVNGNIDVEVILWDAEWLYENCNINKVKESIVIDFSSDEYSSISKGGIPFLNVPQSIAGFECYQCVIPGKVLSHMYREYGSPLLEGNVRSFLTSKTAVNKSIQETIRKEPDFFYIYNNGIAVIASNVEISNNLITKIDNIQIINGGQTTASLALSEQKFQADLSDISVPMKLTVIHLPEDKKSELDILVQKISRTSNSQNKISDADFFSNDPFHLEMKRISERISVPGMSHARYWFYERARGEYEQGIMFRTSQQKKAFMETHPKDMYLTKSDFAKFYEIWEQHPDLVSKGNVACFKKFGESISKSFKEHPEEYNELFFKRVTSVAKLYRELEKRITKKQQLWFSGSYRANIISYSLSMFFCIISKQCVGDEKFELSVIWDKGVTDVLLQELLCICRNVYMEITNPNRPEENVTQWCKKENCWNETKEHLRDLRIQKQALQPYLRNRMELRVEQKTAKNDAAFANLINSFQVCFERPHKGKWNSLRSFYEENKKLFDLNRLEESALYKVVLMDMNKSRQLPSQDECKIALSIWKDAEAFGWSNN